KEKPEMTTTLPESVHDQLPTTSRRVTRVAVAGATGYAGGELTNILARHPHVEIAALFSSSGRGPVSSSYPDLIAEPFAIDALVEAKPEVVFLATPNEASVELVPEILDLGMRVIDLSGAFRLGEPSLYPGWYGFAHKRPELLAEAVYGLTELCNGEL